jgi:RNA polymerase sigma-70 factor (ECF subfamily)
MMDSNPLDGLLQRAAGGDQAAFEQLYAASCRKLYATAYYILKDEALAEEVLQEACIKIWNNAARFDARKASALTWMNRVVRNRALDVLRSQKARPVEVAAEWEGAEHASDNPGPLDMADLAVSSEALARCLDGLKARQREVILLAYLYGHTHDELSRITGSPLGTIKAWIRRGLESLRQCLG